MEDGGTHQRGREINKKERDIIIELRFDDSRGVEFRNQSRVIKNMLCLMAQIKESTKVPPFGIEENLGKIMMYQKFDAGV